MRYSDNEAVFDSSRKPGGAAEHLIDGSEKRICRSTFEFKSSHVIEKRSNRLSNNQALVFFYFSKLAFPEFPQFRGYFDIVTLFGNFIKS